ncbi:AAA family ATPase [Paenibacillus oryzisoli]|uniref:AAA family ATPase n=1 Tax=Paenibacillus oryzisoli TaxID=1850517 RepID=UPI003D28B5A5
MELIYLWVGKFRNIHELGFNFSSKYDVSFDINTENGTRELKISPKKVFSLFEEEKINNVTAIIGRNGSGKTNILDLLGMRMNDRKMLSEVKYFLLYHISEDTFAIEGSEFSLIKDNILNIPIENNQFSIVSDPYSMYLEKSDSGFEFKSFLQLSEDRIKRIHYYNFRNTFKEDFERWGNKISNEHTVFFSRLNLNPNSIGYYAKYNLITYFNRSTFKEKSKHLFNLNDNVFISVYNNISYSMDLDEKLALKISFKDNFRDLIQRSGKPNKKSIDNKTKFIMNFIEDYIQYSFSSIKDIAAEEIIKLKNEINEITNENTTPKDYFYAVYEVVSGYLNKHINLDLSDMKKYSDTFYKLVYYFEQLSMSYFKGKNVQIPIGTNENSVVKEFLQFIDQNHFSSDSEMNYLNNSVSLTVEPMSSGEEAFINLFASLFFGLRLNRYSKKYNAIILLDEPDNFMHPEWSRIMLSEIFNFLNQIELGYKKYQIIITTHSPFIISDLLKSNVIALEKDINKGYCKIANFVTADQTFANNIHTLLSEEFFMSSTIGEFAKERINHVITVLKSQNNDSLELAKCKLVIDNIGEPLLKEKLSEMYIDKLGIINSIKETTMSKEEIRREIRRLQDRLEQE